jgi:hypothetical protein
MRPPTRWQTVIDVVGWFVVAWAIVMGLIACLHVIFYVVMWFLY